MANQQQKFTNTELGRRLAYDRMVLTEMARLSRLFNVQAYRNLDDLANGRRPITSQHEAHHASVYLVDYHLKTLVGKGKYTNHVQVYVNLLGGNNYPYSAPVSNAISKPIPWNPHFHPTYPYCHGNVWEPGDGNVLLAHYIIHQIKALNFADLKDRPGYVGWNKAAVDYWRTTLKQQPITPNLQYPVIPTDLTHGVADTEPAPSGLRIVAEVGTRAPAEGFTVVQQAMPTALQAGAIRIIQGG